MSGPTFNVPPIFGGDLGASSGEMAGAAAGNPLLGGNGSMIVTPQLGAGSASGGSSGGGAAPDWLSRMGFGIAIPPEFGPNPAGGNSGGGGGGLGGILGGGSSSSSSSSTMNWIEEIAIRAMLVIVGIVLIAGGLYLAGRRGADASSIADLRKALT